MNTQSDTYIELADAYNNNKDYTNALLYFKKAITLNHKCYICYYNIASIYNKLNKFELCLFYAQKAVRLHPDFHDALFLMAQCYRKMNNEEKMLEYLHKTLEQLPEHPAANHLLASINKQTDSKYSSEYAKDLFDRYADHFENHLVNSLKYEVPSIMKEKLQLLNPPGDSQILDLGCGTGLLGKALIDIFPNIVGVDISKNMINETRKKDIYTTLHTNDINDFLVENIKKFDLILAADVFIYIGDLLSIFSNVRKCINTDGYFMFTIELSREIYTSDHQLAKSGRFSHTVEYVEALCKDVGFDVMDKEEITLRQENQTGQRGVVFTLQITPE